MRKPDCHDCTHNGALRCFAPCEEMVKYQNYLENRRKFKRGETIKTLDEFIAQEWVFMYGKPIHRGWVHSQPFRLVAGLVENGKVFYAIRKDDKQ